ncbi:cytosolic carboxypeptidase 6 isoform X2 [Dromiciops gliroides]|uniref:cytosolic carboxypeptidase 6 isoform X2 n=1 Tax=Dromiciops gliroides TaxID=33562 RepID=UPI001CC37510|nr:cytosolic carboxypeptidase 6 isoform X2 [Dromiciops gliroides]
MAERSQTASEAGNDIGPDEIIAGNVSKFAAVPVSYYGPPKKGHLIFDACFESGNLGRVDHVSEFEYDLFIRPDTCNPRFRVWFNFTVENVKESQRVIFNIVNFSKTKSLYRDGMTPMVKSTSRPKWQRLPPKNVYYYRCPDHRKNYVMSFAFCFDREDDIYQFAYCYPYTYTRFQHYLDSLQKRNMDYFFREQLGLSVQQRQLDLLTITSPERWKGCHGRESSSSAPGQRALLQGPGVSSMNFTSALHPSPTPPQDLLPVVAQNVRARRGLRDLPGQYCHLTGDQTEAGQALRGDLGNRPVNWRGRVCPQSRERDLCSLPVSHRLESVTLYHKSENCYKGEGGRKGGRRKGRGRRGGGGGYSLIPAEAPMEAAFEHDRPTCPGPPTLQVAPKALLPQPSLGTGRRQQAQSGVMLRESGQNWFGSPGERGPEPCATSVGSQRQKDRDREEEGERQGERAKEAERVGEMEALDLVEMRSLERGRRV